MNLFQCDTLELIEDSRTLVLKNLILQFFGEPVINFRKKKKSSGRDSNLLPNFQTPKKVPKWPGKIM